MCDLFSQKHHDGTCTQMLQNKRIQMERNRALTATAEAGALLLNCKVNSCIYRPVIYCIVIMVMMPIMIASVLPALFISMAEPQRKGELLPEDVGTDDCLTSYTHIYSPDLLK